MAKIGQMRRKSDCKTNKNHGSDAAMEKGIFEGLKVLDCASFIAAPAAATVLADFGAEVIKIEPPVTGDPYRHLPNLPGYPVSPHNYAWMLEARNKRSLALDLSKPEGQAVLHRLAGSADVFITPPEKFSTTTSAFAINSRATATASGLLKSSAMPRLLRFRLR
jgi:hypothetical protein